MKTKDSQEASYMFYCDILLTPTTKVAGGGIYVVPKDADCVPRYLISFHKDAR